MMSNKVRVVSTTRRVPDLKVNNHYPVLARNGKDFIIDEYGGYFPIRQARDAGIVLETVPSIVVMSEVK